MKAPILPHVSRGTLHLLLGSLLAVAACERAGAPAAESGSGVGAPDATQPRYLREYVHLAERAEAPLVVPIAFRAVERGEEIDRTVRGWLAHGATWDAFLEESWPTPRTSGVWRVLPRGDLRLAVGGATDVEALWYRRGERNLRLRLNRPLSGWQQGNAVRFRLLESSVQLGPEVVPGVVLETLQVHRPAGGPREARDTDWLFLTAGDTLRLVIGEAPGGEDGAGRGFAWISRGQVERGWDRAEIRWVELRSYEEARRDVPLQWSFRVPEAGIQGEVSALGMHVAVGPERPGRRAVEARYTVEGWVEVEGQRGAVIGFVRHVQE